MEERELKGKGEKAKALLVLLITMIAITWDPCFGQEQPDKLARANDLFERYEYFKSAPIYKELASKKSPDPFVVERLADSYRLMNDFEKAEKWYEKLAELAGPQKTYWYAEMLLTNQKFTLARDAFRRYYGKNSQAAALAGKLAQCDSAEKWMRTKPDHIIDSVPGINSAESDWGPVLYHRSVVFASDRLNELKEELHYNRTGNAFIKLYQFEQAAATVKPFDIPADPLLAGKLHVGPVAFSPSSDTAYITVTTAIHKSALSATWGALSDAKLFTRRLELIMAVKSNEKWTAFSRFSYNNVNAWSVGHAAISADGAILYFTSDMPGGIGKTDIWYCQKQKNGSWGKPVNCGKSINTKEEEAFPTIFGSKLYFASKGLPGMGGFDIFEARGKMSTWPVPQNLKFPVNSTYDDFWLSETGILSGYFSSNRKGGRGNDDIYRYEQVLREDAPLAGREISPSSTQSRPAFPPPASQLQPGRSFIVNNIYYDLDKWDIRPDAAAELDKLVTLMKENPRLRIELSSHTDSRAPDLYNLQLSQKRAESAVAYLVGNGVDAYRLVAKGYGESRLINACANGVACSEPDHQLNRRTEIQVISN